MKTLALNKKNIDLISFHYKMIDMVNKSNERFIEMLEEYTIKVKNNNDENHCLEQLNNIVSMCNINQILFECNDELKVLFMINVYALTKLGIIKEDEFNGVAATYKVDNRNTIQYKTIFGDIVKPNIKSGSVGSNTTPKKKKRK